MMWLWIVGLIFAGFVYMAMQAEKAKKIALQKYREALSQLKQQPANADLRERALALGRVYSNLMRDKKGNTLFDEVALMNDINAACAAAHQQIQHKSETPLTDSVENRLQKLSNLKQKGLIDEAEFLQRKREILESI
ncbi:MULTISPECIES: SHOCT domain-containing protein [unclassified Pseudomonas]|uniref:SHOCT domain-containing protein n=1 Tax=unclassified Pseudomonas TaxID=196821 RepID=UPI000CD2C48C|nr:MULTISPECIES: SHOCT domain-containing protein [unclassified Pseudomonas]POA35597.1 hypothetical protein C1887_00455 [Pseudomonas sp. GW456-R21]POA65077.1 hypothetical protein C1884_18765 [Pseudomonas sp. GW460-R15]